jgi:hypothetical protein
MTSTPTVTTRAQWAARISTAFRKSVEAILEQGRLLIAAKDDLDYGDFTAMVENDLPFGARTAQMLMAIAADARLSEPNIYSLLPPSWTTLYALTRLPNEAFNRGIAEGVIRPDMIRADMERLEPPVIETVPDTLPLPFDPEAVVIGTALARTAHLDRDGRMTVPEHLEPPANRVPAARAATRTAPRAPTPAPRTASAPPRATAEYDDNGFNEPDNTAHLSEDADAYFYPDGSGIRIRRFYDAGTHPAQVILQTTELQELVDWIEANDLLRPDESAAADAPAPPSSCNFCGKLSTEVTELFRSPTGAQICNECVGLCQTIAPAPHPEEARNGARQCTFCGHPEGPDRLLVDVGPNGDHFICEDCADDAAGQFFHARNPRLEWVESPSDFPGHPIRRSTENTDDEANYEIAPKTFRRGAQAFHHYRIVHFDDGEIGEAATFAEAAAMAQRHADKLALGDPDVTIDRWAIWGD